MHVTWARATELVNHANEGTTARHVASFMDIGSTVGGCERANINIAVSS
jgi:hypothetical protein